GESGTGKELVARAVHYNSPRRNCPFIAIDCAAIPETLIENEFFGHEKGAFTGAYSRINGKFELADQGSIFLDEIGNLSLDVQAKLLRVLQEKEITRIGGSQKIKVDVRIICATNSDLQRAIIEGSFRDDLYYRINVIPIRLPALRERNNDIQLLANHFLNRYNKELNKKIKIDGSAMKILNSFSWPGNVRELDNYIHRLVVENEDGLVVEKNLPYFFKRKGKSETYNFPDNFTLRKIEEIYIGKILKQQKNNISKAARVLGISRKTLHNKLKLME
ncbi:MAG: sigma-54-dependent Fis family transcriptional regulator, partial [Spirochaetes bacterium]|nr:sigma-54-dependent Fis family transcriptional regulator [Spirochaetota bacterium]